MLNAEFTYLKLIKEGATAQEARSVLPNSLKTEIMVTTNIREWMHILDLRCSKASHPQMREIMLPILTEFYVRLPTLFASLYNKYKMESKPSPDIMASPELGRLAR